MTKEIKRCLVIDFLKDTAPELANRYLSDDDVDFIANTFSFQMWNVGMAFRKLVDDFIKLFK